MVSLWAGHADSAIALEAYVAMKYSEDGDVIRSQFASDFMIEYYDEDFREAQYYTNPLHAISDLLRGYSYDNVIVPAFLHLLGESLAEYVNAVVLLYNFKYAREVDAISSGPVRLRFFGVVSMR